MKRMRFSSLIVLLVFCANVFAQKPSAISPIVTSLPTGPGSMQGLAQEYLPQKVQGSAGLSIPIEVPPGRSDFTPELNISYLLNKGNGLLGMGFTLNIPSIKRQTSEGLPLYDSGSDKFVDSSGIELVKVSNNVYRAQFSENIHKYERTPSGWVVTLPDGIQQVYGETASHKVQESGRVYEWKLKQQIDPNGNRIEYVYESLDSTSQIYLKEINYAQLSSTNRQSIQLAYEKRTDSLVSYKPSFELKTAYRLKEIKTFSLSQPVRVYKLSYYPQTEWNSISRLNSISVKNGDRTKTLRERFFSYTNYEPYAAQVESIPSAKTIPFGFPDVDFIDANNDGLPDILNTAPANDQLWLNKGVGESGLVEFDIPKIMDVKLYDKLSMDHVSWSDFDGDGKANLVSYNRNFTAYYNLDDDLSWQQTGVIRDINFPLDNKNVRLFDINNDKRTDVVYTATNSSGSVYAHVVQLNLETGWTNPTTIPMPYEMSNVSFSNPSVRLGDMNGDGLQDVVVVRNKMISYFPGRGLSGFGKPIRFVNSPRNLWNIANVYVSDMNADGLADVVNINGIRSEIWINKGLEVDEVYTAQLSQQPILINAPSNLSVRASRLVDINGNGSTDIVWYSPGEYESTFTYADLYPEVRPNIISSMTNGLGAKTKFRYGSLVDEKIRDQKLGKAWSDAVPLAIPVLKEVTVEDSVTGIISTSQYDYTDGFYSFMDREFRGFSIVNEKLIGGDHEETLQVKTVFSVGKDHEALKGVKLSESFQDASGADFYKDINTWSVRTIDHSINDDRTISLPTLDLSERKIIEGSSSNIVTISTEFTYDDYGNLTRLKELGSDNESIIDERITQTRYSAENPSNLERWMINYPIEVIVSDSSGAALSKKRFYYDDESFSQSNFSQVINGNLTSQLDWSNPQDNTSQINTLRINYTDRGRVSDIYYPLWNVDSQGHHRSIEYDQLLGIFPVKEVINTETEQLVAYYSRNFNYGTVSSFTDFNGANYQYRYDDFGRISVIAYPGDSIDSPSISYAYHDKTSVQNAQPVWFQSKRKGNALGETIDSRSFLDGFGRIILEKTESADNSQFVVSKQVEYGVKGSVKKSYSPYFSSIFSFDLNEKGTNYSEFEYDALSRITRKWSPFDAYGARTYAETHYYPLRLRVFSHKQTSPNSDAYGSYKQYHYDGLLGNGSLLGRLTQVDEVARLDETGNETGLSIWSTHYSYDALGNFTKFKDAQGNVRRMYYDGLGRNYFYNDPNRGYFWQSFDDAGNIIATRDASGREVYYDYDSNGRLLNEYTSKPIESDAQVAEVWAPNIDTRNLEPSVSYNYDRLNGSKYGSSLGRLVKVIDTAGYSTYKYDERGRIIERGRQIQGDGINSPLYITKIQYNPSGQVGVQQYPDETRVTYEYAPNGMLKSISGVIENIEYDAAGNQISRSYENGLRTTYQYDHWQRLSHLKTVREADGVVLQDLNYQFDPDMNIKSITDNRSDTALFSIAEDLVITSQEALRLKSTAEYSYDDLNRLKHSSKGDQNFSYRYDLIGNLLNKTLTNNQGEQHINGYRYGNSQTESNNGAWNRNGRIPGEVPGPSALTSTNSQDIYYYDNNGNLIEDGNFIYQWDHRNRLKRMESRVLNPLGTQGQ